MFSLILWFLLCLSSLELCMWLHHISHLYFMTIRILANLLPHTNAAGGRTTMHRFLQRPVIFMYRALNVSWAHKQLILTTQPQRIITCCYGNGNRKYTSSKFNVIYIIWIMANRWISLLYHWLVFRGFWEYTLRACGPCGIFPKTSSTAGGT